MFAASLQYLPHSLDLLAHVERPGLPLRLEIPPFGEMLPDRPTCLDQHGWGLDLGASHEASGAGSPGVRKIASHAEVLSTCFARRSTTRKAQVSLASYSRSRTWRDQGWHVPSRLHGTVNYSIL